MRKLLKIAGIIILLFVTVLAYLNFVFLPQKVKSIGPQYLEEKSKGQIKTEKIRYIPFKGVRLENITLVGSAQQPLLSIDKLDLKVNPWPLIIRRELYFDLKLYPQGINTPLRLSGRFQKQKLDLDLKAENSYFSPKQTLSGKLKVAPGEDEKTIIDLEINSRDLNLEGEFFIKDQDLKIEKLSGQALGSNFSFIGDVEDLSSPVLNIYAELDLDLAGLSKLNLPNYQDLSQLSLSGRSQAQLYISSSINNPEIGLKLSAVGLEIEQIKLDGLSLNAKLLDRKLSLNKCYMTLYGGEINLQGSCNFNSQDFPANLNGNMFNLGLNDLIRDLGQAENPVHGRVFGLTRLHAPLKNPQSVEGRLWLSAAGSNILQLPLFAPIADVLRMPQLRKTEFKEASGNFEVAKQAVRTDDFKIISNNAVIHFKGYLDFKGDLAFDVSPSFTESFLQGTPNLGSVIGIFFDSTGNFLGEIKMKGNLNKPRFTYKPMAMDKIIPRGLEEGIKQLFKFKDKSD
ncbi:AsmA-like C-terminal region-containing protein [Candidatus Omnitrophota bacterium]